MYLNEIEGRIISGFMRNLDEYENHEMKLVWDDETKIVASFDTCFEDEDDETSEEYFSFVFVAKSVCGNPPVVLTNKKVFLLDYRNFPDKILVDGKKIN